MVKKDIVSRITERLREDGYKKTFRVPRHVLTVTDENGNSANFKFKEVVKDYLYTAGEIETIINMMVDVVVDSLRHGESVELQGIGKIAPSFRTGMTVAKTFKGDTVDVRPHFIPKYFPSNAIKVAIKLWDEENNAGEKYAAELANKSITATTNEKEIGGE